MARALGGLGEVARSLGSRLTQAKQLIQERLAIIRELGHPVELSFSFSLLAQVLNDLGEYEEARKDALEALIISKRIGHPWSMAWSLSLLSETTIGLRDFQLAWDYVYEALENSVDIQAHQKPILIALLSLAFLLAKDRDRLKQETVFDEETTLINSNEWAIEILTLMINHAATEQPYKDKAARLQAELEAELPPEVVAAAIERGKAKLLDDLIAEILDTKGNYSGHGSPGIKIPG